MGTGAPVRPAGKDPERVEGGRARWADAGGNGDVPPPGLVPEDPAESMPPPAQGLEAFSADPLVELEHPLGRPDRQRNGDGLIPTREAPAREMGGAVIGDTASGRTRGFGGPVNIGSLKKPTG